MAKPRPYPGDIPSNIGDWYNWLLANEIDWERVLKDGRVNLDDFDAAIFAAYMMGISVRELSERFDVSPYIASKSIKGVLFALGIVIKYGSFRQAVEHTTKEAKVRQANSCDPCELWEAPYRGR